MAQEGIKGHAFWDPTKVPPKESEDFQKFICGKRSKFFQPAEAHAPRWTSAPNAETFSSFGDQGTTATVNAYGEILQASTYLGVGQSGIFALDHDSLEVPYWVMPRASDLDRWSRERINTHTDAYGLRIPLTEETFVDAPEVGYVHYRWPRYEYKTEDLEFTIQWMVRNGLVLQQCVVRNLKQEEMNVAFDLKGAKSFMKIRDLDHLDVDAYRYKISEDSYVGSDGPHNYSLIWAQMLIPAEDQDESTDAQEPNENGIARRSSASSSPHDHTEADVEPPSSDAKVNADANTSPSNELKDDLETPSSSVKDDLNVDGSPREIKDENDATVPNSEQEQIAKNDKDSVAAVVSVFLNGHTMDWSDKSTWEQVLAGKPDKAPLDDASDPSQNVMEVTTAYKLVFLPTSKAHWSNFVISYEQADVNSFMRNTPFTNISLTSQRGSLDDNAQESVSTEQGTLENPEQKLPPVKTNPLGVMTTASPSSPRDHIEYVVFRNLEHILSVCSMPLEPPSLVQDWSQEPAPALQTVAAIALTCGDISGHRICTSASFFAFQFLIDIAKRLKETSQQDPYVSKLLDRIATVCKGHLMWLSDKVEKSDSKCFAANYWATGKMMKGLSGSWRPNDSLTDTAFHLIKAAEFATFYQSDRIFAQDAVRDVAAPWIESLQKSDRRERFAWPHRQEADTNLFRLDDHVWIWKALKSIEDLDIYKLPRKYAPRDIQREMLRRFTTENDISRTRMLAVSRSTRDTRFLFHARDTALFYGHDWNFFLQETSFREVWENTIKAQAYHDDNQETGWDNALRYTLSVLMGTRNHRINKRMPGELVRSALEVLFRSTSPNGFFPGQLDITTKEPTLFYAERDRDFYFHTSFEIPYILLINAAKISAICERGSDHVPSDKAESNESSETKKSPSTRQEGTNTPANTALALGDVKTTAQDTAAAQIVEAARKSLLMKKVNPFNSLIDSTSIVELEEEWLYNYPAFLTFEMSMSDDDIRKLLKGLQDQEDDDAGHIILDGSSAYLDQSKGSFESIISSEDREAIVVDTQSKRALAHRKKDRGEYIYMSTNRELWDRLKKTRSAETSKKRFIWMPNANSEAAFICYLCSHELERPAMSLFFDRHSNYEKFFFDDTTMFLNTWETELHLSFYQLLETPGIRSEGIPKPNEDTLPGNQSRKITKASLGFRFVGDFFDRYWTCHFIQYLPAQDVPGFWNFEFGPGQKERAWRQRKVLELHLFERILNALVKSTQELFEEVKTELGVRQGAFSFSILSSEDYFASSAQWQKFQHILQAVEDELEASISIIAKWEAREKDRGQEKPRWTRNDERKYSGVIKKLLGSTSRKSRDLLRLHANVKSVKETLISSQDQIRDDLGLRGAENIRFFTYVTVVFLPLGFASSIFSMSGSPEGTTLARMASCAIVALVITVLALVNAKTLGVITEEINFFVDRQSRSTMNRSSIVRRHKEKRSQKQKEEIDKDPKSRKQLSTGLEGVRGRKKPSIESSWHFGFWFAYILIELPARRVLLGYRALKEHRFTWTACLQIIVGVFLLPFCIISYLLQVLAYNLVDLIILFWACVRGLFPASTLEETDEFWNRMTMLTHPPNKSRPFNALRSQMRKFRDQWREKRQAKDKKAEDPPVEEKPKESA